MYLSSYTVSLFFLVCTSASSSASAVHAINRLHSIAIKHSAGIARDLRLAFGSVLAAQPGANPQKQKIYCIASDGSRTTGNHSQPSSTASGTTKPTTKPTSTKSGVSPTSTSASPWKLVHNYEGQDFFDGWDFWTFADPTHGTVQYVSEATGRANGLVDVNSEGNALMRVDTTPQIQGNRQSVRIHTRASFTRGLVVMDAVHMPTGCATWPAFWSNGPNWPTGGEIDIIEGVNDHVRNQATIHTDPGCTLSTTDSSSLSITGTVIGGINCAATQTGNQGCGVRARETTSYGVGFNQNGGGVYAMLWDDNGIAVYFFPRNRIPSDLAAGSPQTGNWGDPMARWPTSSCDESKYFYEHIVIFDTTLCGDWAGAVWTASGVPGQEQSCAARTGFDTCEAFVRARGDSFHEAYWEVRYVKIYELK